MLVEPVAAAGRRGHHAARAILGDLDQLFLAVFPWMGTELRGPVVGVALASQTDEHRAGDVVVRLGVASTRVLGDKATEVRVAGHLWRDPAVTGTTAVI